MRLATRIARTAPKQIRSAASPVFSWSSATIMMRNAPFFPLGSARQRLLHRQAAKLALPDRKDAGCRMHYGPEVLLNQCGLSGYRLIFFGASPNPAPSSGTDRWETGKNSPAWSADSYLPIFSVVTEARLERVLTYANEV